VERRWQRLISLGAGKPSRFKIPARERSSVPSRLIPIQNPDEPPWLPYREGWFENAVYLFANVLYTRVNEQV
jgi:hypothetical protein